MIQIDDGEQSVSIIDALTTLPQGAAVDIGVTNQWVLEKILAELSPSNRNEIVLVAGGTNGARNSERIRLLALVEQAVPGVASYSLLGIGVADNPWLDQALAANPIKLSLGSVNSVAQANHFWESILKRAAEPVARDLKMQLEFNADAVAAYRQVGLATVKRTEASERLTQFQEHDLKAGEEVTSLFEVIPRKEGELRASQLAVASTSPAETRERNQIRTQNMLTVKLNYRLVSDNQSVREVYPFADRGGRLREASENLKFTAAVAAHGMVLSDAPFRGTLNHYGILELAQDGLGEDLDGNRNEFLELVKRTIRILLNRSGRVSG